MTSLDKSRLKKELEHLKKEKQLAFALMLCERMIPALERFAGDTNFNSSVYRGVVDTAWECLEHGSCSPIYGKMTEQLLEHAPDTEEFRHPLTSAALNAVLSIAATIKLLSDGDVSHVVEAAGLARDTAALFAQASAANPPISLGFKEIMKHPLVERELRQQAADLDFLEALPADISERTIASIKERMVQAPALLPPENAQ